MHLFTVLLKCREKLRIHSFTPSKRIQGPAIIRHSLAKNYYNFGTTRIHPLMECLLGVDNSTVRDIKKSGKMIKNLSN